MRALLFYFSFHPAIPASLPATRDPRRIAISLGSLAHRARHDTKPDDRAKDEGSEGRRGRDEDVG
jgi:hypothetical protein